MALFGVNQIDTNTFQVVESDAEMCVVSTYPEERVSARDRANIILNALHCGSNNALAPDSRPRRRVNNITH